MFTVYVTMFNFELAFKAFDVYVELSIAGRSRNRRSDESEAVELDDDELYIQTLANAIGVLCLLGGREGAEKAREVEKLIEDWLRVHAQPYEKTAHGPLSEPLPESQEPGDTALNVSTAYRALGISRAHWARYTYDGDRRSVLQTEALACFKKALDSRPPGRLDIDILYAMSLLSADMRDISEAVKTLKVALASPAEHVASSSSSGLGVKMDTFGEALRDGAGYERERKLVPLWHLLALLLTARGDYTPAGKSCEAVFEQFGQQSILFGDERSVEPREHSIKQDSIASEEKDSQPMVMGVVKIMNNFEKESLLQVKVTQLALIETVEGPAAAVDSTDELFGLYARLFGQPELQSIRPLPHGTRPFPPVVSKRRPATATSGVRSITGSILNKSRLSLRGRDRPQSLPIHAARPDTAQTARQAQMPGSQLAPLIQVTNEDETTEKKESESLQRGSQDISSRQRHGSILKRRSGGSLRKRRGSAPNSRPDGSSPKKSGEHNEKDVSQTEDCVAPLPEPGRHSRNGSSAKAEITENHVRPATSQSSRSDAALTSQDQHPNRLLRHQDSSLVGPSPYAINLLHSPVFSALQDLRHKSSVLIRLWLYVSGLYTRAGMLDDTKAAIDEAQKILEKFELEVAQEKSSSEGFSERGWGAGGSVDELWADIWTEVCLFFFVV